MKKSYYTDLLPALASRASNGTLSTFGFSNVPLRSHLNDVFSRPLGNNGSFIGDPTFEAVFGWKTGNIKIKDLSDSLLTQELIEAMDGRGFNKDWKPYTHQLESWRHLEKSDPQSVIVTSGTGSGKTECFMVPILNQLIKERKRQKKQLVGVRSLFLYPLNALINSQRDRLNSWTKPFGGDIRFCLYNGLTPEKEESFKKKDKPNEVLDRFGLRSSPPPILVTNPTMLEYMLVRAKDNNIIEQSKGKLDTIVLDEAHTYIGSQAAEMALLLRRVLHAFGKKPEEVRFVATSATIGDDSEEAGDQLKKFLTQVAGVNQANVHVVKGERSIPPIKKNGTNNKTLQELLDIDNIPERYKQLENNLQARSIRNLFTENISKVTKLSEVCELLFDEKETYSLEEQKGALQWLDLLSSVKNDDEVPFLPLRGHIFHNTFSGIWACANQNCSAKEQTALNERDWPFGLTYLEERQECECGAPVYEVVSCRECGEVYLKAEINDGKLVQSSWYEEYDDFQLERDIEPEDFNEEQEDEQEILNFEHLGSDVVIANRNLEETGKEYIDLETKELLNGETQNSLELILREDDGSEYGVPCPSCLETNKKRYSIFRSHRVGAPFLLNVLLPTLLEYAPDADKPENLPFRGRRLLTFNDSRQGTARLATKLQQDSERTKARGLIYHHALQMGTQSDRTRIEKVESDIKKLKNANSGQLKSLIEDKEEELKELRGFSAVSYSDLKKQIANEHGDFEYICNTYRKYNPQLFDQDSTRSLVSELLITREFARRPKRQNNLETMGMVSLEYPRIKSITTPPKLWKDFDLNLEEWRNYLKICIDFFVRAGGSVDLTQNIKNWLGLPFYKTYLIPLDQEEKARFQRRWPNARRGKAQSRIVRLLIYLLGISVDEPEHEDIVDALLRAAWQDLTSCGLLVQRENGKILPLENISFNIQEDAWICPITRRFLDTTVTGVTPYLPKNLVSDIHCEQVKIPRYGKAFGGDSDPLESKNEAKEWLNQNQVIEELRSKGLWTIFNDRVIEMAPYYSAAEHSAQQPSNLLQRYERQFKKGKLNILSCSTTMEMGIDIGGIEMVAMNNVPPHPANYLQRAGRAGRREETRSTAVTLCKSNPHDQYAFRNSNWAFDSDLPAPNVSLNSKVIVQRHINAFLLSHFMNKKMGLGSQDKHSITAGWFFIESGENGSDRFVSWCLSSVKRDTELQNGLNQLVKQSLFEGYDLERLFEQCGDQMAEIIKKWRAEYEVICRQEENIQEEGEKNNPALKAISHQKTRIENEYLLRELASRGFLPAYGFPSHITVFDNLTVDQFKANKKQDKTREDNKYNNRDMASRDIVSALREYAPGSEVVMDGRVYKSSGITLNWHIPASKREVRESQAIRHAWRCENCGASGSSLSLKNTTICNSCGNQIKSINTVEYLEPSGFSVDFYDTPHNDITTQKFIPIEKPWVQAEGAWAPLTNPSLGRYRSTSDGQIFHHSAGINKEGYALCMMCGRAEPMESDGSLPKKFREGETHNKLRSSKDDKECSGSHSSWAIKKGIRLGHQLTTDILEIQLRSVDGQWLNDNSTASTLAVALRDSLAELLGVQASELSCDIKQDKTKNGIITTSILIFDKYASGYASKANNLIRRMLHMAYEKMRCPNNCKTNCPQCILDFDQRFRSDDLNRQKGLRFLNQEWLQNLKLPIDLSFFDQTSKVEKDELQTAIVRETREGNGNSVILFAGGNSDSSDIAISTLRALTYNLAGQGVKVELVFENSLLEKLGEDEAYSLASLGDHDKVKISKLDTLPAFGRGNVIAVVNKKDQMIAWAVDSNDVLIPNETWGITNKPIIKGEIKEIAENREEISVKEIRPRLENSTDKEIVIHHDLDGNLKAFGNQFWHLIEEKHKESSILLNENNYSIENVKYRDRYLFNPLSVALILEIIKSLRSKVGDKRWQANKISIVTSSKRYDNSRPGNKIYSDWVDCDDRDYVLQKAFEISDFNVKLSIPDRRSIQHSRVLEVGFSNGKKLSIRLDQGVGYWRVSRSRRSSSIQKDEFEFSYVNSGEAGLNQEAEQVIQANPKIKGSQTPTEIFVKLR